MTPILDKLVLDLLPFLIGLFQQLFARLLESGTSLSGFLKLNGQLAILSTHFLHLLLKLTHLQSINCLLRLPLIAFASQIIKLC